MLGGQRNAIVDTEQNTDPHNDSVVTDVERSEGQDQQTSEPYLPDDIKYDPLYTYPRQKRPPQGISSQELKSMYHIVKLYNDTRSGDPTFFTYIHQHRHKITPGLELNNTQDKNDTHEYPELSAMTTLKRILYCDTYSMQHFRYLVQQESMNIFCNGTQRDWIKRQKIYTPEKRQVVLNWMFSIIIEHYKYSFETMLLASALLDRIIAKIQIKGDEIQLVCIISIMLASKIVEKDPPSLNSWFYITDLPYTQSELQCAEIDLLKKLDNRLLVVTAYDFIHQFYYHTIIRNAIDSFSSDGDDADADTTHSTIQLDLENIKSQSSKITYAAQILSHFALMDYYNIVIQYTPSQIAMTTLTISLFFYDSDVEDFLSRSTDLLCTVSKTIHQSHKDNVDDGKRDRKQHNDVMKKYEMFYHTPESTLDCVVKCCRAILTYVKQWKVEFSNKFENMIEFHRKESKHRDVDIFFRRVLSDTFLVCLDSALEQYRQRQ